MARQFLHDTHPAFAIGDNTSRRLKDVCKARGLDIQKGFKRFLCELVMGALVETSDHRFMLKGGLLYPVDERATSDADITFIENRSDIDLMREFLNVSKILEADGIYFTPVPPKSIQTDGSGTCLRFPVEAYIGRTRVNTQIDVGLGGSVPADIQWRTFKPMLKGAPEFSVLSQPWSSVIGDKFAIVLTSQNQQMKNFRDLLKLRTLGIPAEDIAKELHRTLRDRQASTSLMVTPSSGLAEAFAVETADRWETFAAPLGDTDTDFVRVVAGLREWHRELFEAAYVLAEAGELREFEPVEDQTDNVISIYEYLPRMSA